MKLFITILFLLVTIQPDPTFTDCRVGARKYDPQWNQQVTEVQCTNNGKPVILVFPIDRFAFGSQCAVTKDELSRRRQDIAYSLPFTLRLVNGKWEMEKEQYSVCEAWLNELPICLDNHGNKIAGEAWKPDGLWHMTKPCRPSVSVR